MSLLCWAAVRISPLVPPPFSFSSLTHPLTPLHPYPATTRANYQPALGQLWFSLFTVESPVYPLSLLLYIFSPIGCRLELFKFQAPVLISPFQLLGLSHSGILAGWTALCTPPQSRSHPGFGLKASLSWLLAFFTSFMLAQLAFCPLALSKGFLHRAFQAV